MSTNEQSKSLAQLLDILIEKNSVFCYHQDSEAADLVKQLTKEIEKNYSSQVIRVYWNENEHDDALNEDTTSFHVFRNFTGTLIKIEKLLAKNRCLILTADLSTLKQGQNNRSYIRFLSILLRKGREYKSTMISMVNKKEMDSLIGSELLPYFQNEFILKSGRMKKKDEELIDVRYDTNGEKLYIEPYMQTDINKIKEIFSLTPEEKKELDRIAGQSIEEYKTSM